MKKIREDFKKFAKSLSREKNAEVVSLEHTKKLIELAYMYFNKYDALMYSHNVKMCLGRLMNKLYGIEMNIPKKCY